MLFRSSGLATIGLSVAAVAQNSNQGPSLAKEVSGPNIGPSGQTGELHYLENPGNEFSGGSTTFGPYRLLPPGTKFIPRFAEGPPPKLIERTTEKRSWPDRTLDLEPPNGLQEKRATATVLDGARVDSIEYVWTDGTQEILVLSMLVSEEMLPLDVYLPFDDSTLAIKTMRMSETTFAVIEQPRAGPAPNVGYVSVYSLGRLLTFQSPDVGQDRLLDIAKLVAGQ